LKRKLDRKREDDKKFNDQLKELKSKEGTLFGADVQGEHLFFGLYFCILFCYL
jgi:hypothetical protein